ncbi:hypothetical protein GE09DRAFT_1232333 [Coniochaeta sp. 2T2.1]|nr:hypothetical protein GE09DRAFT_1232333 [Coniochaeta sp. 2T2.1]
MTFLQFLLLQAAVGPVWAQISSDIFPAPTVAASSIPTACAVASSASASAEAAAESGATVFIPPSVALACLQSVPVDAENDVALIDYLIPFLKFQSTLGYLKDPPKGYLVPGVDLLGGLTQIRQKLRNNGYNNQYEFTWDASRLLLAAADGHIGFPLALKTVFSFQRTLTLVSISVDGVQLPKIYDYADLLSSTDNGYTAADVTAIDGVPVIDYLVELSALQAGQDPDAAFNSLFTNIPFTASGGGGGFVSGPFPGQQLPDFHNVTFSNGSSIVYENRATVSGNLTDVDSGEKLHAQVELPSPDAPAPTKLFKRQDDNATDSTVSGVPGYPSPIEIHTGKHMSGYFLNDSAHLDTCVLVLYSFEPKAEEEDTDADSTAEYREFRRVARSFFKDCQEANRTKLLIDLSANGGGTLFDGFELYRNLFPTGSAYSGNRIRANEGINIIGQHIWGTEKGREIFGNILDASDKPFRDWQSFLGPTTFPQDNATSLMHYDFANGTTVFQSGNDTFLLPGFDPADPPPPQPFLAENIVLLTDGYCASTCTVFTGLMAREQFVRTIALGGRPLRQAMQYAGGVKGAQVMQFTDLQGVMTEITPLLDARSISLLNSTLPSAGPPPLQPTDLKGAQFNFRNAYSANSSATDPPLQFVYEAANCRRFYKVEYLTDIKAMWRDMADVAWGAAPCAPGSSTNPDGTIGNTVLGFDEAVVSRQRAYDGPGSLTSAEWKALGGNSTGIEDVLPAESVGVVVYAAGMWCVVLAAFTGVVLFL